jgi:hypothetical protein
MSTKTIVNESSQNLEVFLKTQNGVKGHILSPREVKVIPAACVSDNMLKLQKRRLLSIKNS